MDSLDVTAYFREVNMFKSEFQLGEKINNCIIYGFKKYVTQRDVTKSSGSFSVLINYI